MVAELGGAVDMDTVGYGVARQFCGELELMGVFADHAIAVKGAKSPRPEHQCGS
jgi:hypothetical protein